jgi:hypothetical protein
MRTKADSDKVVGRVRSGAFNTRPCFWEHAERDSKKARLVKLGYLRPAGYSWYEHAKGGLREFFFQCERI